ncbi:kinase-like protein [Zopfia rhizophila CBS 207.26]|uniref:Kinase-like protein n=1 Tax=Zopfia rhizophila CBS 207.26 TaxID=1314779 RepID=A0A6A6D7P1_9PEZI|nr:kinase-like protein [Zopfia rhizophila CBS 207.26]
MSSDSLTNIPEDLHEDFGPGDQDPYQSLRLLGHGGGGSVDEVMKKEDSIGECYARKQMIEQLQEEARTIRRLRHQHIIKFISTYTWTTVFGIIMAPVADTDLQQFLSQVDSMGNGNGRDQAREHLLSWTGCLLQGLDYLHEMRVKHRDIKPSNILIKKDTVYFTDFGISRIVPGEFTTGTDGTFGPMTRAYVAPEALRDDARRRRAVDVFSLGYIFLEIGTLLIGPPRSRERFRRFREEKTGTIAYAENTLTILQWIWHLWGHWSVIVKPNPRLKDRYARHGAALPDLAFLMLDPNPDHQITSRQLVALISTPKLYYFGSVNAISCNGCQILLGSEDDNLPLHSVYKEVDDLEYPKTAEQALKVPVAPHWEAAKRKWLQYHM